MKGTMKPTEYAGIDYGLGKSNVGDDGIRFGVIPQGECNGDAVQEIYERGEDIGYLAFKEEIRQRLESALRDYLSQTAVLEAFEAVEDYIGDSYSSNGESGPHELRDATGLHVKTERDGNDLWILSSPYYTHAQFCSPCAPGAGYLGNPCPDGPKTYCLGHDWFDDGKAPYPVYEVKTGFTVDPA
jgi:hypothetical protein